MSLYRLADGFSSADVQGMSLDPQAQDPDGYQDPRDLVSEPATDGQDPASPGGAAPYNGVEPTSQPVTSDPMWKTPDEPKKPPYSPIPYTGPGPSVDVTTLHNARLSPVEETMNDLWVTASMDAELELSNERLVRAKVATAAIWPFLSAAKTEREFGHRIALVESDLEAMFPDVGFRDQVTASLHDDYRLLTGIVIQDFGTATLTSEAAMATQDGGATAREALLATTAQLEEAPSLFEHLALSEADVPDGGTETASLGNPAFFDSGPEAGPLTGNSGQFEQAAPDPWNPMNAQYPMAPSQWTVPPGKGWVERPMEFGKQGSAGYVDEGVQTGTGPNPEYFSAPEGVTNGQDGFPADVSLPEPDERVDNYGSVPPQTGQPAAPTPPYSNGHSAARFVLAEKDNHGACAHCNSPVYRDGDSWKHLTGDPGHGVRLHDDHPWVTSQQANRVMAARREPNRRTARWVLGEVSSSGDVAGDTSQTQADPMGAPPTPQSMEPGGAGSVAGPPLTIPNDSVSQHPFAGQNPSQTAPMAPGMGMGVMASRYTADTMNRPTAENPLGVGSGDEFDLNNWEAPAEQRPRQDANARRVNTPQRPGQPIPVRSSEGEPGGEEDEEERR